MTIAAFAGANGLGSFIQLGMNSHELPHDDHVGSRGRRADGTDSWTFLLGRVERAVTSEGLLPPDQIKNSRAVSVRSRRKAMAAGVCAEPCMVVSVASYACYHRMSPL